MNQKEGSSLPWLLFNFQSYAKKLLLPPPVPSPHRLLGACGNRQLRGKSKTKHTKKKGVSAKCLPLTLTPVCSKTPDQAGACASSVPPASVSAASSRWGRCFCQSFVLSGSQGPAGRGDRRGLMELSTAHAAGCQRPGRCFCQHRAGE